MSYHTVYLGHSTLYSLNSELSTGWRHPFLTNGCLMLKFVKWFAWLWSALWLIMCNYKQSQIHVDWLFRQGTPPEVSCSENHCHSMWLLESWLESWFLQVQNLVQFETRNMSIHKRDLRKVSCRCSKENKKLGFFSAGQHGIPWLFFFFNFKYGSILIIRC